MPKPSPKEKTITNNILKYLRSLSGCHAVKVHQSQYGSGQADISGVIDGRAFQIEVKRPGQKATPLQLKCLREWQQAGAIVGVCCSIDDVKILLANGVFNVEVFDEVKEMTREEFKRIHGLLGDK